MDCTVLRQLVNARCYCNEWDVDWRRRRDGASEQVSERVASEGGQDQRDQGDHWMHDAGRHGRSTCRAMQGIPGKAGQAGHHRAGSSTSPTLRVHVNRLCALSLSCIFLVPTSYLRILCILDPTSYRARRVPPRPKSPYPRSGCTPVGTLHHVSMPPLSPNHHRCQSDLYAISGGRWSPRSLQSYGVCRVRRTETRRPRRAACGGVERVP